MTQTYSRDNLASLRTDDNDLTTMFASPADYNAVASLDGTTVDQSGSNGYAVFNFKDTAAGIGVTVTFKGQSTKAPSESKAQLQIYKRTGTGAPVWEDVTDAFNDSANANENFTITGTVADLTNYADESNPVACRVWQATTNIGWTFLVNEDDITSLITYEADWNNINLSTKVPAGTTLVLLHVRNSHASSNYNADARYTGDTAYPDNSSLSYSCSLEATNHDYIWAPLDGSRTFDGYFDNSALLVGIVAYTSSAVVSNAVNITPAWGDGGVWVDKDISGSVPTAVGRSAIMSEANIVRKVCFRTNGSSWGTTLLGGADSRARALITGLDSSSIFEFYIFESGANDKSLYLRGYDDNIVWLSAFQDVSPGSNSSWVDCVASDVATGARAAIVCLFTPYDGDPWKINVRAKDASPDNITTNIYQRSGDAFAVYTIVKLDGSKTFQAWTDNYTLKKVYVMGYII